MVNRKTALLTGAATLLAAKRAAAQPAPGPAAIRIASTANDDVTAALYAIHAGLFKRAGLAVELTSFTSGSAIGAAVAGGAIDIGRSSILPLITARSHGIRFALVAAAGLYLANAPTTALIVPAGSPVHTATDLAGKIVSVPALSDLDNVAVRFWIDANGGSSSAVQYVEMPGPAVAAELTSGRVTAGTLQNPFLAQALAAGNVRVLAYHLSALGPRLLQSCWFTTAAYLAKYPGVLREFAGVMQVASAYCNTHEAQTVDLLAAFSGLDRATVAGMSRQKFATVLDPAQIQPLVDAAYKYRTIDAAFDAHDMIAHLS